MPFAACDTRGEPSARERSPSETLTLLAAFVALSDRLMSRARTLSEEPDSARMLARIGAAGAAPRRPSGDRLEQLRRRLMAASRQRQIAELNRAERRYAPWLLWEGNPSAANLPGVLPFVLDDARKSQPALRRLTQAYLRDYKSGALGIGEAAECIRNQLTHTDDRRLDHWRSVQREVELFDPAEGPALLAARLLGETATDGVLARYKLDDPMVAAGGYMMAVEDAVRADAPLLVRDGGTAELDRILKILAPDGYQLRFPSRQADTARALLGSWFTSRGEPAPQVQERVRRVLLTWLGDPRLSENKQQWVEVGDQEAALMRRWLSGASLDLFFRLIDQQHADDSWRYRRAFWLAYLECGAIDDAWLALGADAYSSARAVRELGGAYGRLIGDSRQSALLLRLGPLVVSEFTHIGKMRAWRADWREAPQLGRQHYTRYELMGECLPFPANPYRRKGGNPRGTGLSHFNSPQGYWQVLRDKQDERRASIKMDWRGREGVARPEFANPANGAAPEGGASAGGRGRPVGGGFFMPMRNPQLARSPHHRPPDEAVHAFPRKQDSGARRGQGRVQHRDRLSHRRRSAAAVAKEGAAR